MTTPIARGPLALLAAMTLALAPGRAPVHTYSSARVPAAGAASAPTANPVMRYAPPPLRATSAALFDATTGRWLLLDNAEAPRAQASTTKIMTALAALTYGRLDSLMTVDANAAAVGLATGSRMGLVPGERVPLRDLLYGLLLPSGNDAALAIAAGVGGSVPHFVDLMNAEAARLGLTSTRFADPHGLDAPGHYTSARDLVTLTRAAMDNPVFRQIVDTPAYVIPPTATHGAYTLTNINWFLRWYRGADGVKPGQTGDAGLCQVLSARRHGHWLIGALMNTPDLYTDARDLMNYGFGDFSWAPSGQDGDAPDAAVPDGAPAAPALYFPATGHRVRAGFLDYFTRHGGAAVLGLPRTDEYVQDGHTVQVFAHMRLWWDDAANVAVAAPLGQQSLPTPALARPVAPAHLTPADTYAPVTGHTMRGAILQAYKKWGGAGTFGYPLTEELQQGALTVQYFSNTVLRWAPGQAVTLAPLGDDELRREGYVR